MQFIYIFVVFITDYASVYLLHAGILSKHILRLLSPSGTHTILVFTLVKEALIEIGCVVTSLVDRWSLVGWLVGCHARALWPNGAS